MQKLYKTPETAFAYIDFNGKGYVEEEDFFKASIKFKIPFSEEDIREVFAKERIFSKNT